MKEYNYNKIKYIDKENITFSDGLKINFLECSKGFVTHYNSFNNVSNCIAERNILALPPYFQFYVGEEIIRIVFVCQGLFSKKRSKKIFHSFQLKITNMGYKTFDLT